MAKYIDEEMFKQIVIDAGNKNNTPSLGEFIANLADIFPAADVAPRAEVAREIFEELRRYIINHCYLADDDVDAIWKHIDMLEKKYTKAEPPKEKQPKCSENSENFEKQRLLPGDCFHGEIWYMCPYCFTGIEAHSIPKDRICRKCGKEYL